MVIQRYLQNCSVYVGKSTGKDSTDLGGYG